MKLIGTEKELCTALEAFYPKDVFVSHNIPFKEIHIENTGWIGTFHGVRIEIELSENYHTCSDDRLGLAWTRLNTRKWDCLFGEEPKGFYDLNIADKHKIIRPLMKKIEDEFAHRATSKAWWIHGLNKTEEEWRHYYFNERKQPVE